jgi:hypothetical protein
VKHDDLDPVFHDVFGGSDPAPTASPEPLNLDYRYAQPESSREKAAADQLVERINFEHFAETVFGAEPAPIFPNVGEQRIGPNGKPITFGKADSMDELESSFRRLIKAVQDGVRNNDPETLAFLDAGRRREQREQRTASFTKRMAEVAGEFGDPALPEVGAFLKGFAAGDRAAMRTAVRQMVTAERA